MFFLIYLLFFFPLKSKKLSSKRYEKKKQTHFVLSFYILIDFKKCLHTILYFFFLPIQWALTDILFLLQASKIFTE